MNYLELSVSKNKHKKEEAIRPKIISFESNENDFFALTYFHSKLPDITNVT